MTNTTAHTPGPWSIEGTTKHGTTILDENGPVITTHMTPEVAALIAAAPEMLAALEGCADALREAGKSFALNNPLAARPNLFELHEQVARKAIAKAKGQS